MMNILTLPFELTRQIFEYLSFDEVTKLRQVCKIFDTIGGQVLNDGFRRVRNFHSRCLREIKEELPRRESERRKHELYPRHDVLQAIETRLSLLCMTYSRLIGSELICFIPGKVLDELFRILLIVQQHGTPMQNSVVLLQEMRDISSMAMEHFDEVILPTIEGNEKKKHCPCAVPSFRSIPVSEVSNYSPPAPMTSRIRPGRRSQHAVTVSGLRDKVSSQNRVIRQLRLKVKHMENVTTSLSLTVTEIVKQFGVLQEHLGVSCDIPSTSDHNTGTLGDINNNRNKLKAILPKTGKKRTSSNENDSNLLKRNRFSNM